MFCKMIYLFSVSGVLLIKKINLLSVFSVMLLIMLLSKLISMEGWIMMIPGLGSDKLSLVMVILTIWMLKVIFLTKGVWINFIHKMLSCIILINLFFFFFSINFFLFYIMFEVVLIPMFLLIILYGGYAERLESGFYMLSYTSFGSVPLLIMIIKGLGDSWNFVYSSSVYNNFINSWVVITMVFLAFLMKLPLYGLHIWLPKAHVEAPLSGSMVLAGILLKLGVYGILRLLCLMNISFVIKSLLLVIGLSGGLFCSINCYRQVDMKKLVAYSSVVHMGLCLSGIITCSNEGWGGGVMMSVVHGLCSPGMFFFVNVIYSRSKTRSISILKGYGGLDFGLKFYFFFLVLVNSAMPPFLGFFSESFLGMGLLNLDIMLGLLLMCLFFIVTGFNIYFYSVVSHGNEMGMLFKFVDIQEYLIMVLCLVPTFLFIFMMEVFFM